MFVTRGNILSLLCSTNISYKEKESIIKKYDKLLKKALENANSSTLVELLFSGKVPKSAKRIISEVIDYRTSSFEVYCEFEKIFEQYNCYKESDLYKVHYPKILKKYIVKYLYKENILDVLSSRKKDKKLKQLIIYYGVDNLLLIDFLSSSENQELIKYSLETKFYNIDNITTILYSEKINIELKELIIKRFINVTNILEVLEKPSTEEIKNKIVELKNQELLDRIANITDKDLKELITSSECFPKVIYDILLNDKIDMIFSLLDKMTFEEFKKTLVRVKDIRISNLIIKRFPMKTKLVLANTNDINVLSWIYNDSIPYEIKEFIMDKKENDLKNAIKDRKINSLKICYLRSSEKIPLKVQQLIIELKEDELKIDLLKKPSSIIISEILYGNYCDLYVCSYL